MPRRSADDGPPGLGLQQPSLPSQPSLPRDLGEPDEFMTLVNPELGERVVARYRRHLRRMFVPTIVLIALAVACGYWLGRFPEQWQNLTALGVAAAILLFGFIGPLLSWLAHRYTITTRRVIAVQGLFVRERQEVSLRRGFDVTLRRRGLQAVFRSGDVTIHSGSDHPLVLRDVPDARLIVAALADLSG